MTAIPHDFDHQMEDITASLKDGVLTLRIYCGKPFELDDEQEVPVRLG